jgi:pimeloyl-ACP methyl ester carboxylesterase
VRLGIGDFGYAVRGILYRADLLGDLPEMIHHASATGDLSPFAQRYWERAAGFSDGFADGLHLSVFCSEDVPFVRDDEIGRATDGTFLGRYLIDEYRAACGLWVGTPVPDSVRRPLTTPIPTLLLSGRFDPVNPPAMAARVARALPTARHIVARDAAHGSAFGCAAPAVIHVLTRATLDGLPSAC